MSELAFKGFVKSYNRYDKCGVVSLTMARKHNICQPMTVTPLLNVYYVVLPWKNTTCLK